MNVGFFYMWCPGSQAETRYAQAPASIHAEMGEEAIKTIRHHMPSAQIVHLTDLNTPKLPGADRAVRLTIPYHELCFGRLQHYINLPGDWLYLDTDVLAYHDVSPIFQGDFDVAVCDREGLKPTEERLSALMPYNAGVIFSRSREFWVEALKACKTLKPERHAWLGDQRGMNKVILEQPGRFKVKILPGFIYNYVPESVTEDLSGKALVHYKGKRKAYVLSDRYAIERA